VYLQNFRSKERSQENMNLKLICFFFFLTSYVRDQKNVRLAWTTSQTMIFEMKAIQQRSPLALIIVLFETSVVLSVLLYIS